MKKTIFITFDNGESIELNQNDFGNKDYTILGHFKQILEQKKRMLAYIDDLVFIDTTKIVSMKIL